MIFGVVGYGRFGQLWAEALKPYGEVRVYDSNPTRCSDKGAQTATLDDVCHVDVLFLTVPISTVEATCATLKPYLAAHTIVADCCSVKVHPAEAMQRIFADTQPLMATHPLFGPDSVKRTNGLSGHRIVLCPVRCTDEQKKLFSLLFIQMGLTVIESTPDDHDRQMARSQSLIHFLGRGLEALQLQPQTLSTPDFQALLNINTMVVNDAWQLFLDMHRFNPHTKAIRQQLIQQLQALDRSIGAADDK